jgi:methionyl-tRNA formyltransferase
VPPLSLIFAGSGEFGLPTLSALLASPHRLAAIVSQPDKPAGRGKHLAPTPISRFALDHQLPLIRTDDINKEPLPPADLLIVIAFGQKIAPHAVTHARLGSVNLHGSLLPKCRGAAPIHWTILRGETVTGNSIIRLAERMDAGAVVCQSRLRIGELETAGELHDRLANDGAGLMLSTIEALASGTAGESPQNDTEATLAPKLKREHAHLDFAKSADELARQIRGLYPWPGCHVRLLDAAGAEVGRATLARARAGEKATDVVPGTITPTGAIAAGDGREIEIIELQPEGKRPMPLAAYRNGHRWESGMAVSSSK